MRDVVRGGLMVIRSPTGTGAVRGFLNGSCGILSDCKRVQSLGGGRFDVSMRGKFRPACRVPTSGGGLMTRLGTRTGGTSVM